MNGAYMVYFSQRRHEPPRTEVIIMKRTLSVFICTIMFISALASCAVSPTAKTESSSDGLADKAWLETRLGGIPDNVTIGTADSLGIDMSDFEDDGYIIRTENGEVTVCGATADGLDLAVRKYARNVKYGVPVENVTYHEGARIEKLTIAGRDISGYTVVFTRTEAPFESPDIPLGATDVPAWKRTSEYGRKLPSPAKRRYGRTVGNGEFAATEFVRLIADATGIVLPMLDLSSGAPLPEHYIKFETDERGKAENEFGVNGYAYEVKDGDLFFRGSGIENGCANGVYYFIEHVCGWIGLTYGDAFLSEAEHIDIPEGLSRTGTLTFSHFVEQHCMNEPILPARCTFYFGSFFHANHGMSSYGWAGDMRQDGAQPCLTDEYTYEVIRDNVEAYIEKNVAAGDRIGIELTYIDMSMADNNEFCGCQDCRKLYKMDGGASGSWVMLANRISEDMEEKYPGLYYLVFAYSETKQPPKVTKANENVHVTFCLDYSCFNHPIDSGMCLEGPYYHGGFQNQDFAEWIRQWTEICDWVDIWYYGIDGATQQYDITRILYDDVKFFQSIGVKGIYLEGEYQGMGTGRLNHQMLPVLQWNPDITPDEYLEAMEGFIIRDYGEDAVGAYQAVQNLIRMSTRRMGCQTCWAISALFQWGRADYEYIGEHMDEVLAKVDEMIADAPSRLAEKHCERLSLCILYEGIVGRYFPAMDADDKAELAKLGGLYDLFYARAVDCGYDMTKFPMSFSYKRKIAPTLDEEAQVWANGQYAPSAVKKYAK